MDSMKSGFKTESINVRYIYSACIVTSTPDVKVLHDPWFTQGIYDGSWFHFPKVDNPLLILGDVDFIYISHIHPDHYDSIFLKEYFNKYGVKKILIANHSPNHLYKKMKADGIEPTVLNDRLVIGQTSIEIVPHETGSTSDIDSAIILKYKSSDKKIHCLVNTNDITFDEKMLNKVKKIAGDVDILLCGYTGAGSYPQTYFDLSSSELVSEAKKKKEVFFERYKTLVNVIDAKINIPFAGQYVLGGKLAGLNDHRGVADAVEVLKFDKKAIVLADNGGEIDTRSLAPSQLRKDNYDNYIKYQYINELKSKKMDYERLIAEEEVAQLPLKRLLTSAAHNAVGKSECNVDYYFCIRIPGNQIAVINANKNGKEPIFFQEDSVTFPIPHSEIIIDSRYLFGLLTQVYHWNNAEVGSQFYSRRTPNVYNQKAQLFLNYLTV